MIERLHLALYVLITSFVAAGRLAVPGHDLSLVGTAGAFGFIACGFLFGASVFAFGPASRVDPDGPETETSALKIGDDLANASIVVYLASFAWILVWMPAGPSIENNAYEALSHVWVGFTLAACVSLRGWRQWAAIALLAALSAFDTWMFFHRSKP